MGGSRRPGFWGSEDDDPIDQGTSCLATSPAPGTSLAQRPTRTPAPAASKAASSTSQPAIPAASSALKELVVALIGPQTFGIGVTVGIAENIARSVVDLASLARMFLLADLHDRANGPASLAMIGPLGVLQYGAAELAMWQFGDELKQARSDRDALVAEVIYAIKNPGEVFGNIKADYADKWRRFEGHSAEKTLSGQFEAGRIFGDVLVDVVSLIGTGVVVAKTASRIPRLVRLARSRGAVGSGGGGGAGSAASRGGAVTPSQVAPAPTDVIVRSEPTIARAPEAPLKGKLVPLEGMTVREIQYTKRAPEAAAALRKEFDAGIRADFLKSLANDPANAAALQKAGLSEQALLRMQAGKAPPGYQVHHKLPLDDGGGNEFGNLVLIKDDPFHRALTNLQRELTSSLKPGETATVPWPVPNGFVYPAK